MRPETEREFPEVTDLTWQAKEAIINGLTVRSISVTFSAKITTKREDGSFDSYESSASMTMRHDHLRLSPELARAGMLKNTAPVMVKVYTDLHVAGALSKPELESRRKETIDFYRRLYAGYIGKPAEEGAE